MHSILAMYNMKPHWVNISIMSPAVSAETIQKNLEQMGRQIKNLEKDLETFPPAQSDKDLFVEKMTISFYSPTYSIWLFRILPSNPLI